jgi:hypothetical protein
LIQFHNHKANISVVRFTNDIVAYVHEPRPLPVRPTIHHMEGGRSL